MSHFETGLSHFKTYPQRKRNKKKGILKKIMSKEFKQKLNKNKDSLMKKNNYDILLDFFKQCCSLALILIALDASMSGNKELLDIITKKFEDMSE